jgi:hypothetical protein
MRALSKSVVIMAILLPSLMTSCKSKKEMHDEAYVALVSETERRYLLSPTDAYDAETKFAAYVQDSMHQGFAFPDARVLVWTYPRIALAAEYCGRKEEADRMFSFSEAYRLKIYPNQPLDKTGKFKTLRDAVLYMDRDSRVPWVK